MSEKKLSEKELREVAGQLRQPHGPGGIKTASLMQQNNAGMIRSAIDLLTIKDYAQVLEIGPGNGSHLNYLLEKAANIHYQGLDIAETMVAEATKLNAEAVKNRQADFALGDGRTIPFPSGSFDAVFTVNTVYFWDNPGRYLLDIHRSMKTNGLLSLCFATATFMQQLPFTQYGFRLYEQDELAVLVTEAGFNIRDIYELTEVVITNGDGDTIQRDYVVILAEKAH